MTDETEDESQKTIDRAFLLIASTIKLVGILFDKDASRDDVGAAAQVWCDSRREAIKLLESVPEGESKIGKKWKKIAKKMITDYRRLMAPLVKNLTKLAKINNIVEQFNMADKLIDSAVEMSDAGDIDPRALVKYRAALRLLETILDEDTGDIDDHKDIKYVKKMARALQADLLEYLGPLN